MAGRVLSINVKPQDGTGVGIPKKPLDQTLVTAWGVANDFNNYRFMSKANTKDRAVLLIPKETLDDLQKEGWPVGIGHLGENLTIEGVPRQLLKVGCEIHVGEVILEITEMCHPCRTLANLAYVGKERVDEFINTLKGRRGWYAKVLKEGEIKTGDRVNVA